MSTQPPTSAFDAATQAFPVLTSPQIERLRPYGKLRQVHAGEILFQPGDTDLPFFVLLSGSLDIVQSDVGGERLIVSYTAGQFTGEISILSGQSSMARGRVTQDGEFLELTSDGLRSLIGKDAELSEILMRAFILRRMKLVAGGMGNAILMGSRHSAATLRLREFLNHNTYPYTYVDLDTDQSAQALLDRFQVKVDEIPVVICDVRYVLRNPSIQQLASCLGLNAAVDGSKVQDVIIVGAGPSGLAAAVYAASEGLDALVIETSAPGGQAGSSSKIENYLGFPTGISGEELARRALAQAIKFGARFMVAHSALRLDCKSRPYAIVLDDGNVLRTRTILIATGAQYNGPGLPNLSRFEGLGVYYSATFMESQLCDKEDVIVVGGGNSAGQAAVFLSQTARKVYMLIRSGKLTDTMSRYLIQRIEQNPAIELHFHTEITALEGMTRLEQVTWRDKRADETATRDIHHVFLMTGAAPRTDWLQNCVALDKKGFIPTGRDLDEETLKTWGWPLSRLPQMLETTLPGVFAVGDVRSGNVKRVASAVGEGSVSVHMVHRALTEI